MPYPPLCHRYHAILAGLALLSAAAGLACAPKDAATDRLHLSAAADARGAPSLRRAPAEPSTPFAALALEPEPAADVSLPPVRQWTFELEVVRIEGPPGAFSRNEPLWAMLDEVPGPMGVTLTLRENGFRYGIAAPGVRQTLKQRLESIPGIAVAHGRTLPRSDRSIELVLADDERDRTVFCVGLDGRMRGLSFADARPFFQVECRINPAAALCEVRLLPELREPPGPLRFVRTATGFLPPEPEYRGKIFRELALHVTLPAGGCLVVGPTAGVSGLPLLARPFLISDAAPESRENLFVILPLMSESTASWADR